MKCEKEKIIEYAKKNLDTLNTDEVKEHLKSCPECSAYLAEINKLNNFLNSWGEKESFSAGFDARLMTKAKDAIKKESPFVLVFKPVYRAALTAVCLLLVMFGYKNTIYDNSIESFSKLSSVEINNSAEIKDLKIVVMGKAAMEVTKENADSKSISNLDLILNIPGNLSMEEQKADIRELLKDTLKNKKKQRPGVLNALDTAVKFVEDNTGISLSIAAVIPSSALSDNFRQACLDFDNGNYEKATEGLKAVAALNKNKTEVASSLFKLGFLSELAKKYDSAAEYYRLLNKYPETLEGQLTGDLIRTANARNNIYKSTLNDWGKEPKKYKKLGDKYLALLDFDSAIRYYELAREGKADDKASFNAGWCYKAKGDYAKALDMFVSVSDKDLRYAANIETALIYVKQKKISKIGDYISGFGGEELPPVYQKLIGKYLKNIEKGGK